VSTSKEIKLVTQDDVDLFTSPEGGSTATIPHRVTSSSDVMVTSRQRPISVVSMTDSVQSATQVRILSQWIIQKSYCTIRSTDIWDCLITLSYQCVNQRSIVKNKDCLVCQSVERQMFLCSKLVMLKINFYSATLCRSILCYPYVVRPSVRDFGVRWAYSSEFRFILKIIRCKLIGSLIPDTN